MIKNFDEFVNEGIISDYKKRNEVDSREISSDDKKFVFEFLTALGEIKMPFSFRDMDGHRIVCDSGLNGKTMSGKHIKIEDLNPEEQSDIKISGKNLIDLYDRDALKSFNIRYKDIWKEVLLWFKDKYDSSNLYFENCIKISDLLKMKDDIKKELL